MTSYFEWLGAGVYRVDERSGSMHGNRSPVREVHYGTDGTRLYLRIDFDETPGLTLGGVELRLGVQTAEGVSNSPLGVFASDPGGGFTVNAAFTGAECAYRKILEAGVPLGAFGTAAGQPVRFHFSLWRDGLPMDAVPQQGWLELPVREPDWPA